MVSQAFEQMFESVQDALERNLRAARAGELPEQDAPAVQGSGEIPFDFTIDKDGMATYSTSQYGAARPSTARGRSLQAVYVNVACSAGAKTLRLRNGSGLSASTRARLRGRVATARTR